MKVLEDGTERPMGTVLYGEVVSDETGRFSIGCYVCTSLIKSIDPQKMLVTTESGSEYLLQSTTGKKSLIYQSEIESLRNGLQLSDVKRKRKNNMH